MDSQSPSNPWDFRLARELLHSFNYPESYNEDSNDSICDPPFDPKSAIPATLGDFNRLYEYLNLPLQPSTSPASSVSSTSSLSEQPDPQSTSDSTAPEDISDGLENKINPSKEVRFKEEVSDGQTLTAETRRSLIASILADDSDRGDLADTPTKGLRRFKRLAAKSTSCEKEDPPLKSSLIPASVNPKSSVAWPPPAVSLGSPNPSTIFDEKVIIQPLYTLTPNEQQAKLRMKVRALLPPVAQTERVHVFVDCSNIIIGFIDKLKQDRGFKQKRNVKQPPVSFRSLAYLLERERQVDRRVLVGSHNTSYVHGPNAYLPMYMKEAKTLGYEMNILEPVVKPRAEPKIKAKHGRGNGYATTSGHSSGSDTRDTAWMGALQRLEQGVDEILQMKMLESLTDSEQPATMVLASGDAAEAEYSGGFLKTVERALKKGWKVEVVAWKKGISYEYRLPAFTNRWKGQFKLIELDAFSEEMLAIYAAVFADPEETRERSEAES